MPMLMPALQRNLVNRIGLAAQPGERRARVREGIHANAEPGHAVASRDAQHAERENDDARATAFVVQQHAEIQHDDRGDERPQQHQELALRDQIGLAGLVDQLGNFAHASGAPADSSGPRKSSCRRPGRRRRTGFRTAAACGRRCRRNCTGDRSGSFRLASPPALSCACAGAAPSSVANSNAALAVQLSKGGNGTSRCLARRSCISFLHRRFYMRVAHHWPFDRTDIENS